MTAALPRVVARALVVAAVLALAACGSAPKKSGAAAAGTPVAGKAAATRPPANCSGTSPYAAAQEDPSTRGDYTAGGLYKPGVPDRTPDYVPNVDCIPEPLVVDLPRSPVGNRSPYSVLGKQYRVLDHTRGYVEQGTASYYGSKFHGRRTSNQEVYDMYAFSAAHKSLPLPSFARVTNLDNGSSVVVRVNDRGPFHDGRVIDLSYAAAVKLGIIQRGTGRVEVRALAPGEDRGTRLAGTPSSTSTPAPARPASPPAKASPPVPAQVPARASASTALDQLVQGLPSAAGAAAGAAVVAAVEPRAAPVSQAIGQVAGPVVGQAATPTVLAGPALVLQVASFSSLDNARRALERLSAAGISGARLDDVVAGGRTLWRLRVPVAGTEATELAGRIAGLGFGMPSTTRE